MKDFFISYNKEDKEYAKWVAGTLEENGYSVVIQAWDFQPGNNFIIEMNNAINECDRTIIILSENYLESEYCQVEWSAVFNNDVIGKNKKLIPIRISDVNPTGLLANIVYIDFVGLNEASCIKELLNGINYTLNPRKKPEYPEVSGNKILKFIFKIDKNGKCIFSPNLKLELRNLYLSNDDNKIEISLEDERLNIMEVKLKHLSESILSSENQIQIEYEYDNTFRAIKKLKSLYKKCEYSIKYFLEDNVFQLLYINNFNEFIEFIENLIKFNPNVDYSLHTQIDCYRRTKSTERYFIVSLDEEEFNNSCLDYQKLLQLGSLEYFCVSDIPNQKVIKKIALYFYDFLAQSISINKDRIFEEDKGFKSLFNYYIGLH